MARKANRFERGSGCFACESCGHVTRATGGDNDALKLCVDCYELNGIANQISDNGSTPELEAEAAALQAKIKTRTISHATRSV